MEEGFSWLCKIIMSRFHQNTKNYLIVFIRFLSSPLRVALQVLVALTPAVIRVAATSLTCEGLLWGRTHKTLSLPHLQELNNAFLLWLLCISELVSHCTYSEVMF